MDKLMFLQTARQGLSQKHGPARPARVACLKALAFPFVDQRLRCLETAGHGAD